MNAPAAPEGPMLDFEIFLTNRCNQACRYCYTRYMRGDKAEKKLTFDQLRRFADLVSGDRRVRSAFSGPVKLEISGGEPLLEFDLVKKTVDYIRRNKLDFELAVATNGTLLNKARVDYFVRNGVDMRISLDGIKKVNDRNRRFAAGGGSVFEAVTANLRAGFPTRKHMDRCCITPTLTPETVDLLPEIVDFFRHELGVSKLPIGLEAYEIWDAASIARFRRALRRMIAGFLGSLRPGSDPARADAAFAEFPVRRELKTEDEGRESTSGTLALHYDGYFYPSPDFVVAPPPLDPKYRIGDVYSGIDLQKLKTILDPMLADIAGKCEYRSGPRNPVEGYYWGIVNNYPRSRIDRVLRSTSELNRAFQEETAYYLRLFAAYKRLYTTPGFGDFTHEPRHRGDNKEIRGLRLAVPHGAALGALRESLDYFLYSEGRTKALTLDASAACPPETLDLLEGLSLYALMKALYLDKAVRVTLRLPAGALDAERRAYFAGHGVRVAETAAAA